MKIGQTIQVMAQNSCKTRDAKVKATVVGIYPRFIRCLTEFGYNVCVNQYDEEKGVWK